MKSVTRPKSLGDLRTAVSTHRRAAPRQKGSDYLQDYLLDKERRRLEAELAWLAKRRQRIEARLRALRLAMERTLREAEGARPAQGAEPSDAAAGGPGNAEAAPREEVAQWKTLTVGY